MSIREHHEYFCSDCKQLLSTGDVAMKPEYLATVLLVHEEKCANKPPISNDEIVHLCELATSDPTLLKFLTWLARHRIDPNMNDATSRHPNNVLKSVLGSTT